MSRKLFNIYDKLECRKPSTEIMGGINTDLFKPDNLERFNLKNLEKRKIIIVDFHAEATSEKCAMGMYLDGRVSTVFGTHTHVMTADDRVLPKGTGYITDIGMTGVINSVIGMKPETSLNRFLDKKPHKYEAAVGETMLNAVVFDINSAGRCESVERIVIK